MSNESWFMIGSAALILCAYFCGREFRKWLDR